MARILFHIYFIEIVGLFPHLSPCLQVIDHKLEFLSIDKPCFPFLLLSYF
jgi:hypothetical protein